MDELAAMLIWEAVALAAGEALTVSPLALLALAMALKAFARWPAP